MRILAIETSGSSFSVALADKGKLVSEFFWRTGLRHSELLVPAIIKILKKARWKINSIKKVAVSTGPGSFTGIRVGLSSAKTISQALKVPLVGIDTLDILAAQSKKNGIAVIPMIDALRDEAFIKDKKGDIIIRNSEEFVNELKDIGSKIYLAGSAAEKNRSKIKHILGNRAVTAPAKLNFPRAGVLALLADKIKGQKYYQVEPLYIRRSWAEEKTN